MILTLMQQVNNKKVQKKGRAMTSGTESKVAEGLQSVLVLKSEDVRGRRFSNIFESRNFIRLS